jgi:hypothetical protein
MPENPSGRRLRYLLADQSEDDHGHAQAADHARNLSNRLINAAGSFDFDATDSMKK